jgi:hypothetical protein
VRFPSYLRVAMFTTLNTILNALVMGRHVWLEGRVCRGVFTNWAKRFRYVPNEFVRPTSEDEMIELARSSRNVRVLGSRPSSNTWVVSEETLVSIDDYSGLRDRRGRHPQLPAPPRKSERAGGAAPVVLHHRGWRGHPHERHE